MQIQLDNNNARYKIDKYSEQDITINGDKYPYPVLIGPNTLKCEEVPIELEAIDILFLDEIMLMKPEVILIGTWENSLFPLYLQCYCENNGFALDVMSTGAACRTFTLLTAEQRHVIALLL